MSNPLLTTAEVCSNQQLLQRIQIAIERSETVLKQLDDDQGSMKQNLGSAITYLKMAEADMSEKMGFVWHATDLRRAHELRQQQLNHYKMIGEK